MDRVAIRAERLGKRYRYSLVRNRYPTLRDSLVAGAARLIERAGAAKRQTTAHQKDRPATFWALRDVSFQVEHGEAVGIIGRNGAGKSTLLKILSRVTEPTEGYAEVRGRMGSLLEVGTGFHPELTGRENVFLNGAILGMRRAEIFRRFDEIVDFAEIEAFVDTPVKFYSSGMYLRLAFAVAAHLEPEILVVDEVLAVGDAAFQSKCLSKMGSVARAGRTVLFVSHNMAAMQKLCSRAILIENGTGAADGPANEVVSGYLARLEKGETSEVRGRSLAPPDSRARLVRVETFAQEQRFSRIVATGQSVRFDFYVDTLEPGISCSFTIFDALTQPITYFDSTERGENDAIDNAREPVFRCVIDELLLVPGQYRIDVTIYIDRVLQDHVEAAAFIDVEQGFLDGKLVMREAQYGAVIMHHRWVKPK